jgi:radical SAM protein with 4Fe4S-binding SPASM domain
LLQGLDEEKYQEVCGVAVDFEHLLENLRYFHDNEKLDQTLFVKIIDEMFADKREKSRFWDLISPLCDIIWVEHFINMQRQMDSIGKIADATHNLNGEQIDRREVCNFVFYSLQVTVDGNVFPCTLPGMTTNFAIGSVNELALQEIWNGDKRNQLLRTNLLYGCRAFSECAECGAITCIADSTEYLDDCRTEILARFPERVI